MMVADVVGAFHQRARGSSMKRITQDRALAAPDHSPIFIGDVLRQNLVADGDASLLRVTAVTFQNGARNRLHHHAVDQVLVVTHGQGIVATETEEIHVSLGDLILIPAGERHWHGAEPGQDFTHLSILTPGAVTIDEE
jgi:quercetin dioxygenase-like cupin family protein